MITDDDVDRALEFLRTSAHDAAQARANRIYLDEYTKALKSQIMAEHHNLAVNAQEREAYADSRYIEHLDGLKAAVYNDERIRFLIEAAKARIEAWRTMSATERASRV